MSASCPRTGAQRTLEMQKAGAANPRQFPRLSGLVGCCRRWKRTTDQKVAGSTPAGRTTHSPRVTAERDAGHAGRGASSTMAASGPLRYCPASPAPSRRRRGVDAQAIKGTAPRTRRGRAGYFPRRSRRSRSLRPSVGSPACSFRRCSRSRCPGRRGQPSAVRPRLEGPFDHDGGRRDAGRCSRLNSTASARVRHGCPG
jgi:hypothetical protein